MNLAKRLALRLDPSLTLDLAEVTPDPWQRRVMRSDAPGILLNAARQSGKSLTCAALGVHQAVLDPGLVLLIAPTLRQSKELFRIIVNLWNAIGRPVAAEVTNATTLELANGSRVVCLPDNPDGIRGFSSVKLALVDEASRVSEETYAALTPMLAVANGRLVALSTPAGKRGWWADAWHGGGSWERYELKASENPRISPEFLANERARLGPRWYRQEYCGSFEETVDQFFDTQSIEDAFSDSITPLFAGAAL